MTIATTTTTVTYGGNGVTTNFTFPFVGAAASDIVVTLTSNTGINTILSPSLYTLVFNAIPSNGLWAVGGNVTYPLTGPAIATGAFISITRAVPYTQSVSISNQSNFYPQAVEQALDLLEMQLQQQETAVKYSIQAPITDSVAPNILPAAAARAGGTLQFDSNGQPIVTVVGTSTPTPGQFAQPRKISTAGTATINVLLSDSFAGVSIYQSSSPVTTIQLPATEGPYPIFDGSGNASTANIIVLPPAGKTIDGSSSYVMNTNFQSVTFYWDGTQYLLGSGSQGLGSSLSVSGSITAGTTVTAGTTLIGGTGITSTTGNILAQAGVVSDVKGELRAIPQNIQSGFYTLLLTDHGKHIELTGPSAAGVTVPNGVFSAGQNVVIVNLSTTPALITQGSGMTLLLAGTASVGNRTLAVNGLATVLFLAANGSIISGAGLT